MPVVHRTRLLRLFVNEQVERMTDQFHLIKSLVDRHRSCLIKLLTYHHWRITKLGLHGLARNLGELLLLLVWLLLWDVDVIRSECQRRGDTRLAGVLLLAVAHAA